MPRHELYDDSGEADHDRCPRCDRRVTPDDRLSTLGQSGEMLEPLRSPQL